MSAAPMKRESRIHRPRCFSRFSNQYEYAVFSIADGPCRIEVARLDGVRVLLVRWVHLVGPILLGFVDAVDSL